MLDFLYSIDRSIFIFCNQTLANPVTDVVMPALTNWNQSWIGWSIVGILWILLLWKGGKRGRVVGVLLIPLLVGSDELSSNVLKSLVARPRPCHEINGQVIVQHIHQLVPCGSGYSFPSSHPFNNFALATFVSYYYRNWAWWLFVYASLMGYSRLVVGVHYPSDVVAGALMGTIYSLIAATALDGIGKRIPFLAITPHRADRDRP